MVFGIFFVVCCHVLDEGPNGFIHIYPYLIFFCISTIFLYVVVSRYVAIKLDFGAY